MVRKKRTVHMALTRDLNEDEHHQFRDVLRDFVEKHAAPHAERWDGEGEADRDLFTKAAEAGILGFSIPESYGGGTDDFRFNAIMGEELARNPVTNGMAGIALSNDIVIPYFTGLTNDEQKERWLPGIAAAVSEAGGLGIIAALTQLTPQDLITEIKHAKDMADKPIGMNLTILPSINPPPYDEYRQAIIDAGLTIVETAGLRPEPHMAQFRDAGIKVVHKCTSSSAPSTTRRGSRKMR